MKRLFLGPLAALLCATGAEAQIVRLEILSRESPTLQGLSFGTVGEYERLVGRGYGELDPADPGNAIISDLHLAPKNARGRVEYATDFILLKPVDMSRANGVLRYHAPNRGGAATPTDSVFLAEGTVMLWGAWQGDVPAAANRLSLQVPVAVNPDGSPIPGAMRVEFVGRAGSVLPDMPLQGNAYNMGQIPYQPVRIDDPSAVLTRRMRENDTRILIQRADWAFAACDVSANPFPGTPDPTRVCLRGGFQPEYLYELVYEARDPRVMGIGLAAVRDLVSFFRHAATDAQGTANPLGSSVRHAMGTGVSQAGNFVKTLVHLGFNRDLGGRQVFDAVFPLVAARQTNINMRFAVPGGGGGPRSDHRALGQSSVRGFAPDYHDEIRGHTGGIFARCALTDTCPRTFLGLSGSELWALQGSPVLTDAYGTRDLPQPETLRIYYFAGTQHGTSPTSWDPSATVYPVGSRSHFDPVVRALWVRLTDWTVRGTEPPASQVPTIAAGSLVRPETLRYPAMRGVPFQTRDGRTTTIPEFNYLGWYNRLGLLDFGPRFHEPDESGIADLLPPAYLGRDYAIVVAAVDEDGNEVAGVQPVGNQVPLGTNLPYNYDARLDLQDLAGLSGAFIPFHATRAQRLAAGDARASLEERYGSHAGYVAAVQAATARLVAEGFMLPEDAQRLNAEAEASDILR
jgi:hypothetical protein